MSTVTPLQSKVDASLREATGNGLNDWLAKHRNPLGGAYLSWRSLSLQLHRLTGAEVSDEALRLWWERINGKDVA